MPKYRRTRTTCVNSPGGKLSSLSRSLNRLKSLFKKSSLNKTKIKRQKDTDVTINLLSSEPFRTSTIISEFSCRFSILEPKTDIFRKSLGLNDGSAFVTQKQSQLEDSDEYQSRTYFVEVQPNELPTSSAKHSISIAVSTFNHQTTDIPNILNSYQSSRPKLVTSDVILTSNNESPDDIPISLDFPKSPELRLEEEQQEGISQNSDSEESLDALHESMDQPDCNSEPQGVFSPSNSSVQSLRTQSSNPRFLLSMGDAVTMLDAEDKTLPGDHSISSAIAKGNLVDFEGRQFNPPGPSVTPHTVDEGHDRLVAIESNKDKSQLTALISSSGDIPKKSITYGRTEINKLSELVASTYKRPTLTKSPEHGFQGQSPNLKRPKSTLELLVHQHLRQGSDSSSVYEDILNPDDLIEVQTLQSTRIMMEDKASTTRNICLLRISQ